MHEHTLDDGTVISHSHTHTHTQTKAVLNRMARLIGHLNSTRKMIEDGRDCSEVLIQLSAVDAAIKAVGRIILRDHIEHCIVDAVKTGDTAEIEKLNRAIEQFIR
ncbi:MAG: metal-sensing transcriptional repressor [Quinella sp. 2Q5]|nr:metal-sensing transcriptional repressor [Quinella sp. 2Q5]